MRIIFLFRGLRDNPPEAYITRVEQSTMAINAIRN